LLKRFDITVFFSRTLKVIILLKLWSSLLFHYFLWSKITYINYYDILQYDIQVYLAQDCIRGHIHKGSLSPTFHQDSSGYVVWIVVLPGVSQYLAQDIKCHGFFQVIWRWHL